MREPSLRRRKGERVEDARAAFEANYRAYQYRFVEFFIDHLSDLSRTFRGDLQAMIVLALVGQVYIRATSAAIELGYDPHDIAPERLSTTTSRIADVTGIPRETVRRKLQVLEGMGWVRRNDDNSWRLAIRDGRSTARDALGEIDHRALQRVARLFGDLDAIVAAHANRPPPPGDGRDGAHNGQPPPAGQG